MSNVVRFPPAEPIEIIDEANFAKHGDAALLLRCFEIVKDTLEVIDEPEYSIEKQDDTHIDLIRAFYALKVLFKRKTGHDADVIAKDHWEAMGRHMLEGAPLPDQSIPIVTVPHGPISPEAFDGLTTQELACASFNYADRVRESIMTHSPEALNMAEARVSAIDATTALRKLVLRLSGGSMDTMAAQISRLAGETLQ
jgi:hypothetical protein